MIVALAGHVDHGKTSLVRALTGIDTDRLAEEKRRALTIDLGFAYANIGGQRIGFVDVPGHHRFIQNMVAGIAARQYALLVIAADDGVMPQSREHLQILRLLGIGAGVVALNKADRVAPERLAEVERDVRTLATGTFLDGATILPLSCQTGAGLDALRDHLAAAGKRMASTETVGPASAETFRLPIDRAFALRGSGLVVTGTVAAGGVASDGQLVLGASGKPVRVRGLRVQDAPADTAQPGDRAAINLAGASAQETGRGDWLLAAAAHLPVRQFAMRLTVVDDFPRPVRHNAPLHLYHATSHSQGRLLLQSSAPVPPGATALVDVVCATPLQVKVGDRVVARDQDLARTLGGGEVIDLQPWRQRRSPSRLARLEAVRPEQPAQTLVAHSRAGPVATADFCQYWNLPAAALSTLAAEQALKQVDGHLLHPALAAEASEHIRSALATHHAQHPDSAGLTAAELAPRPTDAAVRLMLAALVAAGEVRLENGRHALADHRAAIPPDVLRLFDTVRRLLDSPQPPSLGDIGKRLRRPFAQLERDLRALPAFGLAIRISPNRYYLPAQLLALADVALRLNATGAFTVRQFRDAAGIGRNVAIEVLEHFDAKGFTRREGDNRQVAGDRECVAD